MTPYEIAMYHIAVWTLVIYSIQAVLMLATIVVLLIIAFYPNSLFAMKRRAKKRATALLFAAFLANNKEDIRYESSSLILTEEELLIYTWLRQSRWTDGASTVGKVSSPDGSMLPHFTVKLSDEFLLEQKRIFIYVRDAKERSKKFMSLSKDFRTKVEYNTHK